MENEYFNQRIACEVKNCAYYANQRCGLGAIEVGNNNAICKSYKCKDEL